MNMNSIQSSVSKAQVNEAIDKFLANGLPTEGAEMPAEVAAILSQASLTVGNKVPLAGENLDKQLTIVELEEADASATAVDLALLAAILKSENEKYQALAKKKAIDGQNSDIESQTKKRMADIDKTLKKMDKSAKMGLFMKIFGWMMVGVALLMAGITCGAAGGLVVGALVGAGAALTLQVLNHTGVMEKLTKAIADGLKNAGCSDKAAEILGAVFTALIEIAFAAGASFGSSAAVASKIGNLVKAGMSAGLSAEQAVQAAMRQTILRTAAMAAKAMQNVFRALPMIMKGVDFLLKGTGIVMQGFSAEANYDYGMAKSEETRSKAQLKAMMRVLDELMDELNAIIEQLMSGDANIAALLLKSDDVSKHIMLRTPRMG